MDMDRWLHIHRTAGPDDAFQTVARLALYDAGRTAFSCVTLEPQWNDNEYRNSCLPLGKYRVRPHTSPRFGASLLLLDTAPRAEVLVHAGNYRRHTVGCILPGRGYAHVDADGHLDVTNSKATLKALLAAVGKETIPLIITADARWAL